mgnify:CR=1 FL=1
MVASNGKLYTMGNTNNTDTVYSFNADTAHLGGHSHLAFEGFQYAREHGKGNEYNLKDLREVLGELGFAEGNAA